VKVHCACRYRPKSADKRCSARSAQAGMQSLCRSTDTEFSCVVFVDACNQAAVDDLLGIEGL
jgi:hypothetical protein